MIPRINGEPRRIILLKLYVKEVLSQRNPEMLCSHAVDSYSSEKSTAWVTTRGIFFAKMEL